jgi:hypothetical protein
MTVFSTGGPKSLLNILLKGTDTSVLQSLHYVMMGLEQGTVIFCRNEGLFLWTNKDVVSHLRDHESTLTSATDIH